MPTHSSDRILAVVEAAVRELRAELVRIDYAIRAMEILAKGKQPRGRPPKLPSATAGMAQATRLGRIRPPRKS